MGAVPERDAIRRRILELSDRELYLAPIKAGGPLFPDADHLHRRPRGPLGEGREGCGASPPSRPEIARRRRGARRLRAEPGRPARGVHARPGPVAVAPDPRGRRRDGQGSDSPAARDARDRRPAGLDAGRRGALLRPFRERRRIEREHGAARPSDGAAVPARRAAAAAPRVAGLRAARRAGPARQPDRERRRASISC